MMILSIMVGALCCYSSITNLFGPVEERSNWAYYNLILGIINFSVVIWKLV
jgi:hypothetical protein